MRTALSFQAKRQLLVQVKGRYQEASRKQKSVILGEFIAATGYSHKYATTLLSSTTPISTAPIRRTRPRRYGEEAQEALLVAWNAANRICAKRLVPFLPELVPILERHQHLTLSSELRTQLLSISAATADRILRACRGHSSGTSTTKRGQLLKLQIPVRTFADWNEERPGFLEGDLVAHCGGNPEGAYLQTLVLTDIATGWTECVPVLHRSQRTVLKAIEQAMKLLPFRMLGIDTDNGSEFINELLMELCTKCEITFTRGRKGKKNDQCFVEQKNGSIVRQLVGYDRFEGEQAYRQLAELYRAVRLYVNFFQPSMKLREKTREGSHVKKSYEQAATPYQRLLATEELEERKRQHLEAIYDTLDPVLLLNQIKVLQDALWKHAVFDAPRPADVVSLQFDLEACVFGRDPVETPEEGSHRKYRRTKKPSGPRWWRTRVDPFEGVWAEVEEMLQASPECTAKSIFLQLQQRYPDQFPDVQLRTLQRRVREWRERSIVEFEDSWLREDVLANELVLPKLRAAVVTW